MTSKPRAWREHRVYGIYKLNKVKKKIIKPEALLWRQTSRRASGSDASNAICATP